MTDNTSKNTGVLFLTTSTIDLILNALAIEFVVSLDEEMSQSIWYDPDKRYLLAGVLEVLLCGELLLEPFYTNQTLCDTYDIDEAVYDEVVGGPIKDRKVATQDAKDPHFMSPKDKLWIASARVAKELHRDEAMKQFEEVREYFGIFDRLLKPRLGGIFARYVDYYTWSRWDKVLFLPRVPKIGETSTFKGLASIAPSAPVHRQFSIAKAISTARNALTDEKDEEEDHGDERLFMNFNPDSHKPSMYRFFLSVIDVFKCRTLKQSVGTAYRRRKYHQIPFRLFDGMFEYFSFSFICFVFPSALLLYAYLIFGCETIL